MCHRRVKKAHLKYRKTAVSEQGRLTKVKRIKERREETNYALESMREWLQAEQRSI